MKPALFRYFVIGLLCLEIAARASAQENSAPLAISGRVTDPQNHPVPDLRVFLFDQAGATAGDATTDKNGSFTFHVHSPGTYTVKINAPGFEQVTKSVRVTGTTPVLAGVQLGSVAQKQESITVTADVKDSTLLFPDPAQRVYVRQELLDANPGRPGAPISIPGVPIETASGGIKAPQYFS
ncbi:MAG: carboxypeptidase regulatory-like domain-containing protein, partial [Acidobacteriaceae bacterium]|nr:carboxypeptidase regulatory-like domain-containing protein [Acidobacteriaceae bacterium]